jgi:glycosyltransferase involved in cell wall biosynthesis
LSNAIIEYMAAGLPVVCTDVGGNVELVQNNRNGYRVPSGDHAGMAESICRLLDNKINANKMGLNSALFAENQFSIDTLKNETEKYYCNVVQTTA